ncbi:hypothetical protein BT63DRAFT_7998 [Microthyrium microscopicum]|uniref:F-box domain-containing protein n=1 Tax=Microthyrium microscopicum TaxID=703497 RepID=A0A6A6US97_9PEZI|nr:hypothetical protein BT63DRAFT_7998 [Microthyrium microscopicum]
MIRLGLSVMDIFNLCLVSRCWALLIQSSCVDLAEEAFHYVPHMLQQAKSDPISSGIGWLGGLVYSHLTAVLVDRFRLESFRRYCVDLGFSADNAMGDAARARIDIGLHVAKMLSEISKDAYRLPDNNIPRMPLKKRLQRLLQHIDPQFPKKSISSRAADMIERREELIFKRRRRYLMSNQERGNFYCLTEEIVRSLFKTKYDLPHIHRFMRNTSRSVHLEGDDVFDWSNTNKIHQTERDRLPWYMWHDFRDGESWVNWCLLHEGPKLLWLQWGRDRISDHHVRERLIELWNARDVEQIRIERKYAVRLWKAMPSLCGLPHGTFNRVYDLWSDMEGSNTKNVHRNILSV